MWQRYACAPANRAALPVQGRRLVRQRLRFEEFRLLVRVVCRIQTIRIEGSVKAGRIKRRRARGSIRSVLDIQAVLHRELTRSSERQTLATFRRSVVVSILFVVFGGPGILLVYVPWQVTRFHIPADEARWQVAICVLLAAIGLVPLFESIWRFIVVGRGTLVPSVPTEHLVISGLYGYVRNPMYLGVLIALGAEVLLLRSRGLLLELVVSWLGMELFVRLYEERRLARSFREEYAIYCLHVRRWLPRLAPWRASAAIAETRNRDSA